MKPTTTENRINWWMMWGGGLLCVIGLLWACNAEAGELGFSWTAPEYPHPLSYEISVGGEVLATPAGSPFVLQEAPDACQSRAYEIRAVGHLPDGTLLRSEPAPIQSMARPV